MIDFLRVAVILVVLGISVLTTRRLRQTAAIPNRSVLKRCTRHTVCVEIVDQCMKCVRIDVACQNRQYEQTQYCPCGRMRKINNKIQLLVLFILEFDASPGNLSFWVCISFADAIIAWFGAAIEANVFFRRGTALFDCWWRWFFLFLVVVTKCFILLRARIATTDDIDLSKDLLWNMILFLQYNIFLDHWNRMFGRKKCCSSCIEAPIRRREWKVISMRLWFSARRVKMLVCDAPHMWNTLHTS